MKFTALRDIEKGEIIIQSPGVISNIDCLINTGMINKPYPRIEDAVGIEMELDPNDKHFKLKMELIE